LYFFRESFLAELAISFLPYWAGGLVVVSMALLVVLLMKICRKTKPPLHASHSLAITIGIALLFIRSAGLGTLYSSEFFSFYSKNERDWVNQAGLKVYYANILYTNYDYESLKKQIDEDDYDMVVLVEFSEQHEKALKGRFQERFPYVNRNSRSTKLAGDIVFSKYPITNILGKYAPERGRRKYSYLSVDYGGEPYYFYVVHTSAPVSRYNFEMRNNQLQKLNDEFRLQALERPDEAAVIMVGDFNLTPWSAFYKKFEKGFEGRLAPLFRKPIFTRSLRDLKFLNAHIDRVFTSGVKVGSVVVEDLLGSDHHAISFDVWSNIFKEGS
jgi:endonuclease/exonuclease/phosphatase (EEP) superfamily protein YafD